jgi:hypothetical protein
MQGAGIVDGIASVRAMVATRESVRMGRPVRLDQAEGPV